VRCINIQHRLVYEIFENKNGFTDADGELYDGITPINLHNPVTHDKPLLQMQFSQSHDTP
jgi:hypothetical protein